MKPVVVNSFNFQKEVLKSSIPVLVDFWANWCAPCKMISPIVEQIAQEYPGKLKVAKVDVDVNREIANAYNIMSIPTLMLFKEGRVVDQIVGALPKSALVGRIERFLDGE
ncbi:MAG: thioredoxin [Candidatus Kryptoniota bacterium]